MDVDMTQKKAKWGVLANIRRRLEGVGEIWERGGPSQRSCLKVGFRLQKRGSSPKLIIWNNGLINALTGDSFKESRNDFSWWGRLIESAVGAHLLNHLGELPYSVYYWRYKGVEIDFVVQTPRRIWGLEVKSGKSKHPKGMSAFMKYFPEATTQVIGPQGYL
jgi:hypothetical protein